MNLCHIYVYTLNGNDLNQVHEQRDFGVIISDDLHPRERKQEITKTANQKIGMIQRGFSNVTQRRIQQQLDHYQIMLR